MMLAILKDLSDDLSCLRNLITAEFWLSLAVVGGLMVSLPIVFHCL
jgi:hypothetical protein